MNARPLFIKSLKDCARNKWRISCGPIRLLCMPRTLAYCFNPLSIYFCYRADGTLAALVYQVHNTFGERHSYVMPVGNESGAFHQHCQKTFYVSPFMDMNMRDDFRVTGPGQRIGVRIRTSSAAMPGRACGLPLVERM